MAGAHEVRTVWIDGPGTIEIHQKEVRKGLTDGTGMISFSAPASELIDFSTKEDAS